ncbi:MAG: sugar transferase, partial [Proteobacteria bacterium]|nr:sugar transferase [Pseudomonadota bacterium]
LGAGGFSPHYATVKRLLDVVMSLALLAFVAPSMAVVAVAIELNSPGPIIFSQTRVGRWGRPFTMYKFRSMVTNADPAVHQEGFRKYAEGGNSEIDEDGSAVKDANDSRITRIGRFLRKTDLDELPQLINVIRGSMSVVGPRPAIHYELEWYEKWYHGRFQALPGITGLWQVSNGRFQRGLEEMMLLDLEYIRRRSILLDLRIMLFTVIRILQEFVRTANRRRRD